MTELPPPPPGPRPFVVVPQVEPRAPWWRSFTLAVFGMLVSGLFGFVLGLVYCVCP